MRLSLQALAREPLAQFAVIGLALYGAVQLAGRQEPTAPQIVVDRHEQAIIVQRYLSRRGRLPTAEELSDLSRRWAHREVLFERALALGLHMADDVVRDRMTAQMRDLLLHGLDEREPDEATLRAWFEKVWGDYSEPPRLSFHVARAGGSETEARAAASVLNGEVALGEGEALPETFPFLRLPRPQLQQTLPEGTLEKLEALEPGRWAAVEGREQWNVVRLDFVEPGEKVRFEDVAEAVALDWLEAENERLGRAAVEDLATEYEITIEPVSVDELAESIARRRASAQ